MIDDMGNKIVIKKKILLSILLFPVIIHAFLYFDSIRRAVCQEYLSHSSLGSYSICQIGPEPNYGESLEFDSRLEAGQATEYLLQYYR